MYGISETVMYGMVRYCQIRYGQILSDTVWSDTVRYGMSKTVRYGKSKTVRYGMVHVCQVRYGPCRSGTVWSRRSGKVWSRLVSTDRHCQYGQARPVRTGTASSMTVWSGMRLAGYTAEITLAGV